MRAARSSTGILIARSTCPSANSSAVRTSITAAPCPIQRRASIGSFWFAGATAADPTLDEESVRVEHAATEIRKPTTNRFVIFTGIARCLDQPGDREI